MSLSVMFMVNSGFFFLKTEAGIRIVAVMGVQACALPIFSEEIVYRHKRLRSRRLITVFGPVSITRMEYSSRGQHRDRKSTRLNSSHGYISYAVFCLKKKKNTNSYKR